MNFHSLALFVHVSSATILIGASISSLFFRPSLRNASTVGEVRTWIDFARRSARANPIASLALLATGLYLGSAGWWTSGWFAVAVALFVFDVVYPVRAVVGETERIGRAAAALADGPVPAELDALRRSERLDLGADLLLGGDVAVLFLMIDKPTLPLSIGVATLGIGSALVLRALRRRGRSLVPAC